MNDNHGAEEYETLTLIDEEGVSHDFEVEAVLELDGQKYAVLIPLDEEYLDSNEAIIMRFGLDENGEEILFDIEDDDEWEKVADAYDEIADYGDLDFDDDEAEYEYVDADVDDDYADDDSEDLDE